MARTWQEDAIALGLDPDTLQSSVRQPFLPPEPTEPAKAKRSKFGAVRTEYAGRKYDSKAEAKRAAELDVMLAAGSVRYWMPQPVVFLGPARVRYTPDFLVVTDRDVRFEDVKGVETERFRVVRQLWRAHGPAELWVLWKKSFEVIEGA